MIEQAPSPGRTAVLWGVVVVLANSDISADRRGNARLRLLQVAAKFEIG